MMTREQRRAALAAAIDKAILRGLLIYRPGRNVPIRSGAELLSIESPDFDGESGGYYFKKGSARKD